MVERLPEPVTEVAKIACKRVGQSIALSLKNQSPLIALTQNLIDRCGATVGRYKQHILDRRLRPRSPAALAGLILALFHLILLPLQLVYLKQPLMDALHQQPAQIQPSLAAAGPCRQKEKQVRVHLHTVIQTAHIRQAG